MVVGDSSENAPNRRKSSHLSSFFLLLYHTQTYKKRVRKKTRNKKEEPRSLPRCRRRSRRRSGMARRRRKMEKVEEIVCKMDGLPVYACVSCFMGRQGDPSRIRREMKYFKWFA